MKRVAAPESAIDGTFTFKGRRENLTHIAIPEGVRAIGKRAFEDCSIPGIR
jgi:hypothetical protein